MADALHDKYGQMAWFGQAASYLMARFASVENRLIAALRYVELNRENGKTFSYEFASILRDTGSIFGSVADALLTGAQVSPRRKGGKYAFPDYRDFLRKEIPDIHRRSVVIRPCFPPGVVVPFEALQAVNGTPGWWRAHNDVKHHEYKEFRAGSLENCVTAVSSLALLGFFMGTFQSDSLFVNVGLAHKEGSVDMSPGRRLFT